MGRGIFITLEGPDGGGKSTQAQKLYKYLRNKGYSVIRTREPGGTKVAEKLRSILLDAGNKISSLAEIFLYEAIRAQHVQELIKPAVDEGKIIICERFSDATFAYQGYGRGKDMNMIKKLDSVATDGVIPHLTILRDIPPKTGKIRLVNSSKKQDRIEQENIAFHKRVREGYLELARKYPGRIKIISALGSKQDIHEKIAGYVEEVIRRNRIKRSRK